MNSKFAGADGTSSINQMLADMFAFLVKIVSFFYERFHVTTTSSTTAA